MKIKDILRKGSGIAFEFFAPKTEEGEKSLFENLEKLESVKPAYVSVTYGAGGGNRVNTQKIVKRIATERSLTVMAHLTCIGHTADEIAGLLDAYKNCGIENIMALRGDPPKEGNIHIGDGDFPHAVDMIRFIRQRYGEHFSLGAAAFPEVHPESPDMDIDMYHFKSKVEAGIDFSVTQMFFDNENFYAFIDRCDQWGLELPVIPGIMPITNFRMVKRSAELSGARIPQALTDALERYESDSEDAYKAGVEFAVRQCEDLIRQGFRFLHFFTMNKSNATMEIYEAIRDSL